MAVSIHPYQRANMANNYMTLDMNTLNDYDYRKLPDKCIQYQINQNYYHLTRQTNPITLSTSTISSADPSNLPSDNRPTLYSVVNLNDNEFNVNQYQTNINNPNLWKDNLPAKGFYYSQNEANPYVRQLSNIRRAAAAGDLEGIYAQGRALAGGIF